MAHYFTSYRSPSLTTSAEVPPPTTTTGHRSLSHLTSSTPMANSTTKRGVSILDPMFTQLMTTDVVMMLEWSLRDGAERAGLHQQMIADLQCERDDALHALHAKDLECREMEASLNERVAQETLSVHYQFEERLMARDRTIDSQQQQLSRLELLASHTRAHLKDSAVQAGDATSCAPSEREQFHRQLTEQRKHLEELLASERGTNDRQRQHWEEVHTARLEIERDAAQRNLDVERAREQAERSKAEVVLQRLQRTIQERDERIASISNAMESLQKERAADAEDAKRTTESFAQVRRSMEKKLDEVFAQHAQERSHQQSEFDQAMRDQADVHERMLQEERAQRKRVEEELGLLRADRSRVLSEHRDELKAVEAKLTATQVELTKSTERVAELDNASMAAKQSMSTKEREIREKCARWEDIAKSATQDRSDALARIAELETQLHSMSVKDDAKTSEAVRALEARLESVKEQHRRDLDELERRHASVQEELRRKATTESEKGVSKAELQVRDAQARAQQFERALGQAYTERDAAQLECSSLKRQLRDAQHAAGAQQPHLADTAKKRAMSTQTEGPAIVQDDDESFALREQLMRMNQTVWALQSKLQQSEEDIEFLEGTINTMRTERTSADNGGERHPRLRSELAATRAPSSSYASPPPSNREKHQHVRATSEGPSPFRDDERTEASALFTYFARR